MIATLAMGETFSRGHKAQEALSVYNMFVGYHRVKRDVMGVSFAKMYRFVGNKRCVLPVVDL